MNKKKIIYFLCYLFWIIFITFSVWVAWHLFSYCIHELPLLLDNHFGGH